MAYTITAESKPDYDDWGPDDYWSLEDWITWHKALVKKYGKSDKFGSQKADTEWLTAWNKQGFGSGPKNALELPSLHKPVIDYLLKEAPRLFFATGASTRVLIPNNLEVGIRGAELAGEAIVAAVDAVAMTIKIVKITVVVALIGATIFGTAYVYKNYIKD